LRPHAVLEVCRIRDKSRLTSHDEAAMSDRAFDHLSCD
jgi:hypothetical protein